MGRTEYYDLKSLEKYIQERLRLLDREVTEMRNTIILSRGPTQNELDTFNQKTEEHSELNARLKRLKKHIDRPELEKEYRNLLTEREQIINDIQKATTHDARIKLAQAKYKAIVEALAKVDAPATSDKL